LGFSRLIQPQSKKELRFLFLYPENGMNESSLFESANQWRQEWGYVGKGGVVIFFNEELQGWQNSLRNPEHWQPGCIAISDQGDCWRAVGGDALNGALAWESLQ
jgi:hypothetical protein